MTTMRNVGGHDGQWMWLVCKKHGGKSKLLRKMVSTSSAATTRRELGEE